MSEELTALGGTLIRWGQDLWSWRDGKRAANVRDLTLNDCHGGFRCRNYADASYVEVPVKTAAREADLAWVLDGGYRRDLSGDHAGQRVLHGDGRMTRASESGRVIPEVYLVPLADWDRRAADCCGAQWDLAAESEIFAKARALGWRNPQ